MSVPDAPAALPSAADPDPEFASPVDPSCPPVYGDSVDSGKLVVVAVVMVPLVYFLAPLGDLVEVSPVETDLECIVCSV